MNTNKLAPASHEENCLVNNIKHFLCQVNIFKVFIAQFTLELGQTTSALGSLHSCLKLIWHVLV